MQTVRRSAETAALMTLMGAIMTSTKKQAMEIKSNLVDAPEATSIPRSLRADPLQYGHGRRSKKAHKVNRLALSRKAKLKRRRAASRR